MYYKQIIVVNKELNMSKGKMAAQVSHASMAFLSSWICFLSFISQPHFPFRTFQVLRM